MDITRTIIVHWGGGSNWVDVIFLNLLSVPDRPTDRHTYRHTDIQTYRHTALEEFSLLKRCI